MIPLEKGLRRWGKATIDLQIGRRSISRNVLCDVCGIISWGYDEVMGGEGGCLRLHKQRMCLVVHGLVATMKRIEMVFEGLGSHYGGEEIEGESKWSSFSGRV